MRYLAIVVSVVLSVNGSACFNSSTQRPSGAGNSIHAPPTAGHDVLSGRLEGRATLIGGPCVCPRPLNNGVFALRSRGQVVVTITTDKRGRFSAGVPAGRYRITTSRGALYAFRPRTIRVSADRTTRLVVRFDI